MKFKPYKLLLAISVPGLLLALVAAGLIFSSGEKVTTQKLAPDFSLDLLDGGKFQLSAYKGTPVTINFFASWCHPCRQEIPSLVAVRSEYKPKGVHFLAIAIDDTAKDVNALIAKLGFTFPAGLDTTGKIKDDYGVYGLPTTFFIDKKGMISYSHAGSATKELLRHELDKLLL
ncbi:MAG: TlpA disulfide reductase family protein [Mariprofundus sp.]|nr:TlpA disulfide reductase family protein [Mariprofundus sp.]